MSDIHTIIQNWTSASDEECQKIKEEVYKINPSWKDAKLRCVLANNDRYVFYKDYFLNDDEKENVQSVLYDLATGQFILSDQYWQKHIPEAYYTIQTFCTTSLLDETMLLVFFKYTGVYGVQISKQEDGGGEVSFFMWLKDKETLDNCIEYCNKSNEYVFVPEDNTVGNKKTYYNFDTAKLTDRHDRWYDGEWKKMDEDGITYDSAYATKWGRGLTMHERAFHITDYDQFIKEFSEFREPEFACDICKTKGIFSVFFHCPTCLTWKVEGSTEYQYPEQNAYNECKNCHEHSTHEHTLLPSTDSMILEKYMTQRNETMEWRDNRNKEYTYSQQLIQQHHEESISSLKTKLSINSNLSDVEKESIHYFIENVNNRYSKPNFVVIKDPNLVFDISAIFKHLIILTSKESFQKWINSDINSGIHLIYLLNLDIETSANIINFVKNDGYKSDIKIITSTDHVSAAVDFIQAIDTWKKADLYVMMIRFKYTGIYGMVTKTYYKLNPRNVKTNVFWFQNEEEAKKCSRYFDSINDFNYNHNKITRADLNSILQSESYIDMLETRKKEWYSGGWKYMEIDPIIPSDLLITTFEHFSAREFTKPEIKELHLTLCC